MKLRISQKNIRRFIGAAAAACAALMPALTASAVIQGPVSSLPAAVSNPPKPLGPYVYSDSTPVTGQEQPMFGGGSLTMLQNQEAAQMMSMILQSADGGLVVVDGGWVSDADHLLAAIRERGGHVNAWLITHPDSDHAGALFDILGRSDTGIVIDHIYAALTDITWYYLVDPGAAPFIAAFRDRLSLQPAGTVTDNVAANTQISVPGIEIKVLNDAIFGPEDPVNNSSVVYRADMNGVRIVFLGDLAGYGGSRLLETVPQEELRADIVQMAHHGQNGVGRDVYEAIAPSICLWPSPAWLWNNDSGAGFNSGSWRTLETRSWIQDMGVTRNYVMKDGDITLR